MALIALPFLYKTDKKKKIEKGFYITVLNNISKTFFLKYKWSKYTLK